MRSIVLALAAFLVLSAPALADDPHITDTAQCDLLDGRIAAIFAGRVAYRLEQQLVEDFFSQPLNFCHVRKNGTIGHCRLIQVLPSHPAE